MHSNHRGLITLRAFKFLFNPTRVKQGFQFQERRVFFHVKTETKSPIEIYYNRYDCIQRYAKLIVIQVHEYFARLRNEFYHFNVI